MPHPRPCIPNISSTLALSPFLSPPLSLDSSVHSVHLSDLSVDLCIIQIHLTSQKLSALRTLRSMYRCPAQENGPPKVTGILWPYTEPPGPSSSCAMLRP